MDTLEQAAETDESNNTAGPVTTTVAYNVVEMCGSINQDAAWVAGNLYLATCDVTVNSGVTLMVEPGVIVKFESSSDSLNVNGALLAQGTPTQPVVFTSYRDDSYGEDTNGDGGATVPGPANWQGIKFTNAGSGSSLDYVVVRYAGHDWGSGKYYALWADGASPTIRNGAIAHSYGTAIRLDDSAALVEGNTISDTNATGNDSVYAIHTLWSTPTINSNTIVNTHAEGYAYAILTSGSSPTIVNNVILDTTNTGHGNAYAHGIHVSTSASATVTGNTVSGTTDEEHHGTGIYCAQSADASFDAVTIENNTLTGNQYAVHLLYSSVGGSPDLDGNIVSGNDYDGIRVTGHVSGTATLPALDPLVPYLIGSNWDTSSFSMLTVFESGTLTLEPGVIFKAHEPPGTGFTFLKIEGTLLAQGNAAQPIIFTSLYDDSVAGDTNNDGDTTAPAAGDWTGVKFTDTSTGSLLEHVTLKYAGRGWEWQSGYQDFYALWADGASPTIRNGAIAHSYGTAVRLDDSAALVEGNTISDTNATGNDSVYAIYTLWSTPTISGNTIVNTHAVHDAAYAIRTSGSSPTIVNNVVLSTTNTGHGNAYAHGIHVSTSASATVTGNTVSGTTDEEHHGTGIYCAQSADASFDAVTIENNTLTGNQYAMRLTYGSVGGSPDLDGNIVSGNDYDGIRVTGHVSGTATLPALDPLVPYLIGSDEYASSHSLTVFESGTLTLEPGVVFKAHEPPITDFTFLQVEGTLLAQGNATQPIVFTSLYDDSVAGDTNNDGDATTPAAGDWTGIKFTDTSGGSLLEHITLNYAGRGWEWQSGYQDSYALWVDGASPTIRNSTLKYNKGMAVRLEDSWGTLEGNTITGNGSPASSGYGIYTYNSSPTISGNSIWSNLDYGLYNASTTTINAKNNWWGSYSGPYHSTLNPGGQGDRVSDQVDFEPWLGYPAPSAPLPPTDPAYSTVEVIPSSAPADGATPAFVVVTLHDANDQPIPGKRVYIFSSRGSTDSILQPTHLTGMDGKTEAWITSHTEGTATVTAWDASDDLTLWQTPAVAFTPVEPDNTLVVAAVENLVYESITRLEALDDIAAEAAGDGDWFQAMEGVDSAREAWHTAFLVIDAVTAAPDFIDSFKAAYDVARPGASNLWELVQRLPSANIEGRLNPSWMTLAQSGNYGELARAMAKDGAEDVLLSALETGGELSLEQMENAIEIMVAEEDRLTTTAYPQVAADIDDYLQDLTQSVQNPAGWLPPLNGAEQELYAGDLNARRPVPIVLQAAQTQEQLHLSLVHSLRQTEPAGGELGLFLGKFSASFLSNAALPGIGSLLFDVPYGVFEIQRDKYHQVEDQIMYNQAINILGGVEIDAKRIWMNDVGGFDLVQTKGEPLAPTANIGAVINYSEGQCVGPIQLFVDKTYSEFLLTNTSQWETPGPAAFEIIATYGYDSPLFGSLPFWSTFTPVVVIESVVLEPGESKWVRIYYKDGAMRGSPIEDSAVTFDILGTSSTGTYYVSSRSTIWSDPQPNPPCSFTRDGGPARPAATTAPVENPLDSFVRPLPDTLAHQGQLWAANPFTQTIVAQVTQTLPAGVELLDYGDGAFQGNALTWNREISPTRLALITYTFQYTGDLGTPVVIPSATMSFTLPGAGIPVQVSSLPVTFTARLPVRAEFYPPGRLWPGVTETLPVTVTNLLTDGVAIGNVTTWMTDLAGTVVYTETSPFSIGATLSQTLPFTPPATLDRGLYFIKAALHYGGVERRISHGAIAVGAPIPQVSAETEPVGIVRPHEVVTYSLTLSNTAGITLSNVILTATAPASTTVISDSVGSGGVILPGAVRWTIAELAEANFVDLVFAVQIDPNALEGKLDDLLVCDVWVQSDQTYAALAAEAWNLLLHPEPSIAAINPSVVFSGTATAVSITGTNFISTPIVAAGDTVLLDVTYIDSMTLTATVPATLPTGVYTITVTNPDGQTADLVEGLTVISSTSLALLPAGWRLLAMTVGAGLRPTVGRDGMRPAGAGSGQVRYGTVERCRL